MGGIDDVRIYNRALLPAEVAQLFASEAVPPSLTGKKLCDFRRQQGTVVN
ncbi:MAG: hypothetical protein EBY09_17360, partial [Verrucomicrobia bacterium]|nr:hypothetical protein [Verrucomicrobiota bacterium]